jgi:hypothetical protein
LPPSIDPIAATTSYSGSDPLLMAFAIMLGVLLAAFALARASASRS